MLGRVNVCLAVASGAAPSPACPPQAIEGAIGGNAYQHSKVNQWTTSVVEQTLSQLTKLGKPFKYIVTCVIMQKNGAGLHTASSCFWDNSSDGTCTVRWENKTMYCIVSAFGLAL
uniref:Dynein light chain Tctex-type 1 n=1 Tax=Junco hyemalis TaxID=40217 RepID=A0A8C5JRT0_JUNHY